MDWHSNIQQGLTLKKSAKKLREFMLVQILPVQKVKSSFVNKKFLD